MDVDVALTAGDHHPSDNNRTPFLIDSGTSNHICGDKTLFTHLKPHYAVVSTADKTNPTAEVREIGTILFSSQINGKEVTFSLSDVYYIPDFCNLVSVGQLLQKEVKIVIGWQGLTLATDKMGVFARGKTYKKNLFKLDATAIRNEDTANTVQTDKRALASLWHRRLGHVSEQYLVTCINKGVIDGINANDVKAAFTEPCITCVKGKKARDPFPDSDQKAGRPLGVTSFRPRWTAR